LGGVLVPLAPFSIGKDSVIIKPMKTFHLNGSEYIELCNLLKLMDLASSGAVAKHLISEGKVKVDGQIELRKRCKIRSGQVVAFSGEEIKVS
jgi:ribosome-associated protein